MISKTLSEFQIGEVYATGPGHGLIGTKTGPEEVLNLLTGEKQFVPHNRLGSPLCSEITKALTKALEWKELCSTAKPNPTAVTLG